MSNFRKRNVKIKQIEGTRTSTQTGQMITSSGSISLDLILGGGLPIGSICLIEEDTYGTHAKVLAKYFLAEGHASEHSIFVGSLDDKPAQIVQNLPTTIFENVQTDKVKEDAKRRLLGETEDTALRIAWRYNNLVGVNQHENNIELGHHFDLLHVIGSSQQHLNTEFYSWNGAEREGDADGDGHGYGHGNADADDDNNKDGTDEYMKHLYDSETDSTHSNEDTLNADAVPVDGAPLPTATASATATAAGTPKGRGGIFTNDAYMSLLCKVHTHIKDNKFAMRDVPRPNLYRVCLTSLGSPLWYDDDYATDILKFLTILRATVRSAVSVCFITMPMSLIAKYDASLVDKIRNLVDYAIELESFAGSERETNPAFQKYHGLLHLRKVSAINTLSPYMPVTTDFAFKLRRKHFAIEKLHLPPELQDEDASDDNDDNDVDMLNRAARSSAQSPCQLPKF